MPDTVQKFFMDENFGGEKDKKQTENVKHILELFYLLDVEEKAQVKRLIREENIF